MSDTAVEQVSLAELLRMALDDRQIDLHVAMPARVEAYDAARQTVEVTPQLNRALPDGAGNQIHERLPKLVDVPVVFPRCGRFSMTFPLAAGDFVLLVFAERSLAAWRAIGAQCDPGDLGMHGLDGAVALPGLFPDAHPAAAADGSTMRIGSDTDANGRIEFSEHEMHLGQGATKGVARTGDSVNAASAWATWFAAVGTALSNAPPSNPLGTISGCSSHVKAVD